MWDAADDSFKILVETAAIRVTRIRLVDLRPVLGKSGSEIIAE